MAGLKIKAIAFQCNNCHKEQIVRDEHDFLGIRGTIYYQHEHGGDCFDWSACNWDCAAAYMLKQKREGE